MADVTRLGNRLDDSFYIAAQATRFRLEHAIFTQTKNLWFQRITPEFQRSGPTTHLYQEISETQYADHHPRPAIAYYPGNPQL